jgi:HlyD family secretion protein
MKHLFPIEIQEYSVQSHWVRRNTKSKLIYFIIILALIAVIVSLPFIYVDISTQSRGVIRTPNENNILQSAIYGEIKEINMSENKPVSLGDTLVLLKTDEIDEQITRNRHRLIENQEFIQDIEILLRGGKSLVTPKYKAEQSQYFAKINELQVSISQSEKEYNISKTLYEKHVESKYEYDQKESQYNSTKSQLSLYKQQQQNTWQAEKTRLEYENRDIQSELAQLEKRKTQYVITAPVSGNIVQFTGAQVGNFITNGQQIAYISSGDSLMVECYVSPLDIGYIHIGQDVKFQMDTYDYQQWGLLNGKVCEIISDIVQMNNQPVFRVRCKVEQTYLQLPNGYKGDIRKGMSTTARFHLTKRSLAQLLFDKIDNWMNPNIID